MTMRLAPPQMAVLAHHDRPPFSGRPSLTEHYGHGWACRLPRPVAIDPELTLRAANYCIAKGSCVFVLAALRKLS